MVEASMNKRGRSASSSNVSVPDIVRREKASADWYVTPALL